MDIILHNLYENETIIPYIVNETTGDGDGCGNGMDITDGFDFKEFNFPNPEYLNPRPFTWAEYSKIGLYVVAICAVMVGNIGVILAVALNSSLRFTINYYLANLAVADVLICVCCMWTHLVNHLTEPLYVLGPVVCKFNGFAQIQVFKK
ncbi:unnamed protein product [Oppiella nova]|uniref:G-protein coupled receptors family 1 profile domain-containing protein n=1 Tax=Oppiella nova TaxID=334625 RepID=A0A7R9MFB0_9ACAR|nr:unnamed protein product [Oppiella nova]CAG2176007.1 unnamed protein product [Oppiella nova]